MTYEETLARVVEARVYTRDCGGTVPARMWGALARAAEREGLHWLDACADVRRRVDATPLQPCAGRLRPW